MSSTRPREEAEPSQGPTLTVAAVARRLGVAPATLRTWARRYDLGPSAHTAGAHRRYTVADLARLMVMRRLTLDGVAPSEAARIAVTAEVGEGAGTGLATVTSLPSPAPVPDLPTDFGRGGGGNVIAVPDAGPAARGLARAAQALDARESVRILRAAIDVQGVPDAWDRLVVPVLSAMGKRWEATGTGVEAEHLLSECTQSVLRAHTLAQPLRQRASVLLGCAEQEYHSLPVVALGAALAEQGLDARMLGAALPRDALAAAVRRTGPAAVLVYAAMPVADAGVLEALPRMRPAPRVLAAGPGWDGVPLPAGLEISRVTMLREALREVSASVGH